MRLKEFDVHLDIKKNNKVKIEVVQNDNNTNILNIFLADGADDYTINSSAEVVFLKSNDEIYTINNVEIEGNKIICLLSNQALDIDGTMLCEVRLLKDDIIMTIGQIEIYVRRSIY